MTCYAEKKWNLTLCGWFYGNKKIDDDPDKVTCPNCLRKIEASPDRTRPQ